MNLRQAAQQALEALEEMTRHFSSARLGESTLTDSATRGEAHAAMNNLRAALAEPEQETTKQKPVAWTDGRGFVASHADSFPRGTTVSPLYAHPPTPRKPLTEGKMPTLFVGGLALNSEATTEIVRAVEKAHGIGEQT